MESTGRFRPGITSYFTVMRVPSSTWYWTVLVPSERTDSPVAVRAQTVPSGTVA